MPRDTERTQLIDILMLFIMGLVSQLLNTLLMENQYKVVGPKFIRYFQIQSVLP